MTMRGEVIGSRTMPEVYVGNQTHLLERVEEAIHGGHVHVGKCTVHATDKLVSRHVIRFVEKNTENRFALIGDATTVFTDRLQGAVDSVGAGHNDSDYDHSCSRREAIPTST